MENKEFIKAVEEFGLDLTVESEYECYFIKDVDDDVIAHINKNVPLQISTDYNGWDDLCDEDKESLFKIFMAYASRPIDEHEEEKKFYLRHRWLKPSLITKNYLNYWIGRNVCWLDDNNETADVQTRFTLKEIEEIKKKFDTDLKDFKRVEVKE